MNRPGIGNVHESSPLNLSRSIPKLLYNPRKSSGKFVFSNCLAFSSDSLQNFRDFCMDEVENRGKRKDEGFYFFYH